VRLRRALDTADVLAYGLAHKGDAPRVDKGLQLVTKSADFSAIWLATAGVLAATQGRAGRRAAARGLLAVGLTSAVVNGPMKSLVRRPRPNNRLVPVDRIKHRRTRTTSFPSGHSASAAAFAVGAGSELPVAALPLGTMAALVAASRVRTGAHYPGDVLAGLAIGATVALTTKRVWPVPPAEAALAHPGHPDPTQARETGKGIAVVVNPDAGPAFSAAPAEVLREQLPDLRIVEIADGELDAALASARDGSDVIGAAGGDGSVNATAAVALEHDLPLAVVPAGTLNHFARDIGLETVDDTIEAIKAGAIAEVDAGLIAGEVFLNTASLGSYVELVDARERLEGRIGKWPAVAVALARVLRSCPPVEIELDGKHRRVWMVFFGNCRYRPAGFAPSWRERLDDNLVDVRVIDAAMPFARLRLLFGVLTGTLGRTRAYEQRTAASITVRSLQGPLRLARDGEVFDGPEEFVVEKASKRLRVYAHPAE
jgi:undecaprenyl-diphosphatase